MAFIQEGLTGFEQVSVAIGLGPTGGNSSTLGTVLFMGMFNPQRHDMNQPAYQNFVRYAVPYLFDIYRCNLSVRL